MRAYGFSTGALAPGNFDEALMMLADIDVRAIELSALRIRELQALVDFTKRADLERFTHISVHAPTDYHASQESAIVEMLVPFAKKGWPIIAHPDVIHDFLPWRKLGAFLYIENMDKRKMVGRTVDELASIFEKLPEAQLCFDIAHARQVDTTMLVAYRIARDLRDRIKQIHISTVSSQSKHNVISQIVARSFHSIASYIPCQAPAILETPVGAAQVGEQLSLAEYSLDSVPHFASLVGNA